MSRSYKNKDKTPEESRQQRLHEYQRSRHDVRNKANLARAADETPNDDLSEMQDQCPSDEEIDMLAEAMDQVNIEEMRKIGRRNAISGAEAAPVANPAELGVPKK